MTVQTVLDWLDSFAPFATAEDFDNVGLLAGDARAEVNGALFCLDATPDAVAYAAKNGCNLIISHHPLLFHGAKRINYTCAEGRALRGLMGADIHLIAAHTNLDKAPGGIADSLAQAIGLCSIEPTGDPYVRVGMLEATPLPLPERVEETLHIRPRVYGEANGPVRLVAVGPGACGEGYEAALRVGAQAYLTGEIHHHQILDATWRGLVVLDAGHFSTEWPGVRALSQRFNAELARGTRAALYPYPPYAGVTLA